MEAIILPKTASDSADLLKKLQERIRVGEGQPMTASQVALLLSVDSRAVHLWAKSGYIPHFTTPGGHLRFHVRDVQRFMARQAGPGTEGYCIVLASGATQTTLKRRLKEYPVQYINERYAAVITVAQVHPRVLIVDPETIPSAEIQPMLKALRKEVVDLRVVWLGRAPRGADVESASVEDVKDLLTER